jgi:hypothetical protein
MFYPLSCNKTYDKNVKQFVKAKKWDKVIKILEKKREIHYGCDFVNVSLKGIPTFRTVLHEAALQSCSKEIFDKLLSFGASKSLKTNDGETAYDIAKRLGLNGDILHILSFPGDIMKNEDSMIKMQTALHRLMRDRVAYCLDKDKVHMPQLVYFYEFGQLYFEVPGWYGGFDLEEHKNGIQVKSMSRVCEGSKERHIISFSGKVELIAEGEA